MRALALLLAGGAALAADALQTREAKTSGFDAPGALDVQQQFDVGDVGQLRVDVVAATADGGLVADRAIAAGTSWVTPPPAPAAGTLTYRIAALDRSIAQLDVHLVAKLASDTFASR